MPVTHAYAKLNLSLEVVGKRPDGFHDLVSIMQTVTLADTLTVTPATDLDIICDVPGLPPQANLAYRAAALLRDTGNLKRGCTIQLGKEIPVAAGLGGGSSDAAAALVATSRLWGLPGSCEALAPLAERLGSDVPFFLTGGTALVEGRGERVTALPPIPETWYVLVKPAFAVSTAEVFGALRPEEWTDGTATREMTGAIRSGLGVSIALNTLQAALFCLYPNAKACFDCVERLFPGRTMLSGSGPTIFAVCRDQADATEGARRLSAQFWTAAVRSCSPPREETPCR